MLPHKHLVHSANVRNTLNRFGFASVKVICFEMWHMLFILEAVRKNRESLKVMIITVMLGLHNAHLCTHTCYHYRGQTVSSTIVPALIHISLHLCMTPEQLMNVHYVSQLVTMTHLKGNKPTVSD